MNKDQMKEKAQDWQESAEQSVQELREEASHWREKAKKLARDAGAKADDYVHESPWIVIGSIAVLSFALGALLARRRD
jgi:ElaB protein